MVGIGVSNIKSLNYFTVSSKAYELLCLTPRMPYHYFFIFSGMHSM